MIDILFFRYNSNGHQGAGHVGVFQEQSSSTGSKVISLSNGSKEDSRVSNYNVPPTSNASSSAWPYTNNKPTNTELPAKAPLYGNYLDMAHNKPGQDFSLHHQSQSDLQSERSLVAQNVSSGTIFTELPPPPPSRTNKESPPPYDEALLNHQNSNGQSVNGVLSNLSSIVPVKTGVKNGVLEKRQIQAASDVVHTLSQLNKPSMPVHSGSDVGLRPIKSSDPQCAISNGKSVPNRLPYGLMYSPPVHPQTTNATIPHGDYHIASFTKPIPTSSYITSLSSDAVAASQYQLPHANVSRNNSSPPLQPIPVIPTPSSSISSASSILDQSNSFTNTFLRGILTSIDSKDPVVANAWLETLLDAIDLLPADVIRREIVALAVKKSQPSQSISARKSSCRLLGKIATKLDQQLVRQEVLPTTLILCQDLDADVRYCMCRHLALVSCGIGLEATKNTILPQIVELCDDKQSDVRLAAIETVVQLLGLLDDNTCKQIIIPLIVKTCEQAKETEDETLVNIAHYLGRLCYGLMASLNADQKNWFLAFYQYLSKLGLNHANENKNSEDFKKTNLEMLKNKHSKQLENDSATTVESVSSQINDSNQTNFSRTPNTSASPMPDLVSMLESTTTNLKTEIYSRCRYECAYNFPAMVLFAESKNFSSIMYPTFASLSCDLSPMVRSIIASSLHELAKIIGTNFDLIKNQIVGLFSDNNIDVLEHMVANMVHIIDALARSGKVLQFGQGGQFSEDISNALVSFFLSNILRNVKMILKLGIMFTLGLYTIIL